jgi:hypothetical protein
MLQETEEIEKLAFKNSDKNLILNLKFIKVPSEKPSFKLFTTFEITKFGIK